MITDTEIDDFFRRCHIDNTCKVDGQPITAPLLIELLCKFAKEQVSKSTPAPTVIYGSSTQNKQMDDYEFNMHKHWKDDQDDDNQNIKHFQD
jgi:hypothetical protein